MKSSIGTDAAKLTTSKFATLAISTVTAMLLSRFLTLKEYGTYSQILLVTNLVGTIFMLGLPNSLNFFLARAENEIQQIKFLSVYYTLNTLISFLTGLTLVLSTPLIIGYFKNEMIESLMFVLAVYPWTKIILASIDNIFVIYKKTTLLIGFRIANSLFILTSVCTVRVLNLSFITYMGIFIIGQAVFTLSVYVIVTKAVGRIKFYLDRQLIKSILRFSMPIGLASVINTISIELDKLIIGRFFTTEQLAIYTNASKELPVSIIASSLTAVLMPQMVRFFKNSENEKAISLWKESTVMAYLCICLFSTGFIVYAPEVMTILYSKKFLAGVSVFRVFNLVSLLRCTYFGMVLNATGKTKFVFYSSIVALILNLILAYFFYLMFGFIGPAIATLVAITLIALLQLLYTSKIIGISFARIFPWKSLLKITCLNITFGIIFYYLKVLIPLETYSGEIVESIMLGIVWVCVYLIITHKVIIRKWKVLKY